MLVRDYADRLVPCGVEWLPDGLDWLHSLLGQQVLHCPVDQHDPLADGFFDAIRRVGDRNNVCGLPPIYLMLRLLPGTQGEVVAYDRCPADANGTSLVSICGVTIS